MINRRDSGGHQSPPTDPSIADMTFSPLSPGASVLQNTHLEPSHTGAHPISPSKPMNPNIRQPDPAAASTVPAQGQIDLSNPRANKIAIPRLAPPSTHRGRRRSAKACEPCRQRKIKCDGETPCGPCAYNNSECIYGDAKRVRDKKELASMTKKVHRYEHLLRSLEGDSDEPTARRIRKALRVSDDNMNPTLHSRNSTTPPQHGKSPGEDATNSDSSVGSLQDLDKVDEDLNRDENARAAGFYGKNSEVVWMQRLEDNVERESISSTLSPITPVPLGTPRATRKLTRDIPIAMMNYHLDDLQIPHLDESDAFAVPPRVVADEYFQRFFTHIHPSFPAIRRQTFTAQYRQFVEMSSKPPRKWLGILNMVFAIGCRHCRLANPAKSSQHNDLIFLTRVRKLVFDENVLFEHTDLQQIQLEFLVSLYLLYLGQINRASKFSSMALRSALSLGINLRHTDYRLHDGSKEARSRLWWSIYILEHLLTSMHGRASGVGESLCSVPPPLPVEEESFDDPEIQDLLQNSKFRESQLRPTLFESHMERKKKTTWIKTHEPCPALFFFHLVDLTLIAQAVLNKIYSIEGLREGTSQTEYRLQKYGSRMDRWRSKIHPSYQFNPPDAGPWQIIPNLDDESIPYARERVCLAMNYYSARITLSRPCLTQTHSIPSGSPSPGTTPAEPSRHAKFRTELATTCLQAACSLISVLPKEPDESWLVHMTPWWSVLHFLMQATTALLLGLSYCSFASPPQNPSIARLSSTQKDVPLDLKPTLPLLAADLNIAIAEVRKALSWIHAMASLDPAARRAFLLCDSVIRKIAPGLILDLEDWPSAETLVGGPGNEEDRMGGLDELVDFEG
ncbi:hypothetical protein N7532_002335, partial [Penicillium argentinense]